MTVSITPNNSRVFSGNPVILDVQTQEAVDMTILLVSADGESYSTWFTGHYDESFRIDISEILDSVFDEPERYPTGASTNQAIRGIIRSIAGQGSRNFLITVENYGGYTSWERPLEVFRGGVSKAELRRMAVNNTDAMSDRFYPGDGLTNLLTTRTMGSTILISETELHPIPFIHPAANLLLKTPNGGLAVWKETGQTDDLGNDLDDGTFCVLNIAELRKYFFDQFSVLYSIFDLYSGWDSQSDGDFCCRIIVTEAPAAPERHRVRFLNSLGAWEVIDLVGRATMSRKAADGDSELEYREYDGVTADYTRRNIRALQRDTITVPTGIKRPDQLAHIMDMMNSESVWLEMEREYLRVIPRADELTTAVRPIAPQQLELSFDMADDERRYTAGDYE